MEGSFALQIRVWPQRLQLVVMRNGVVDSCWFIEGWESFFDYMPIDIPFWNNIPWHVGVNMGQTKGVH